MVIGYFGGSFNPAHIGHFELVKQVLHHQYFNKVLIIPTFQNPLKLSNNVVPVDLRWKIIQATFKDLKQVEVSDYELKQAKTNYTYQTLAFFQNQSPNDSFVLIMGEDTYKNFHQWKCYRLILQSVRLLVVKRSGLDRVKQIAAIEKCTTKVDLSIPEISSTFIRDANSNNINQSWIHSNAQRVWKEYLRLN